MQLKSGVKLERDNGKFVSTQAILGMIIANEVFARHDEQLTVTSVCEGTHGANSKHCIGNAFDVRIRDIGSDKGLSAGAVSAKIKTIVAELKKRLGENYDVVLEATHLHVEYDPK